MGMISITCGMGNRCCRCHLGCKKCNYFLSHSPRTTPRRGKWPSLTLYARMISSVFQAPKCGKWHGKGRHHLKVSWTPRVGKSSSNITKVWKSQNFEHGVTGDKRAATINFDLLGSNLNRNS